MPATVIKRRSTADGKDVLLWDDGSLTWAGSGTFENTGFSSRTLRELGNVLEQMRVRS